MKLLMLRAFRRYFQQDPLKTDTRVSADHLSYHSRDNFNQHRFDCQYFSLSIPVARHFFLMQITNFQKQALKILRKFFMFNDSLVKNTANISYKRYLIKINCIRTNAKAVGILCEGLIHPIYIKLFSQVIIKVFHRSHSPLTYPFYGKSVN